MGTNDSRTGELKRVKEEYEQSMLDALGRGRVRVKAETRRRMNVKVKKCEEKRRRRENWRKGRKRRRKRRRRQKRRVLDGTKEMRKYMLKVNCVGEEINTVDWPRM